jgi:hypothetical protein
MREKMGVARVKGPSKRSQKARRLIQEGKGPYFSALGF